LLAIEAGLPVKAAPFTVASTMMIDCVLADM
jgi:hypothetical protein